MLLKNHMFLGWKVHQDVPHTPVLQEEPAVRSDQVSWDFTQVGLGTLQGAEPATPGQSVSACSLPDLMGRFQYTA